MLKKSGILTASLTPQQRIDILLEIVRPAQDAHPQRIQRVSRIVKLGES